MLLGIRATAGELSLCCWMGGAGAVLTLETEVSE